MTMVNVQPKQVTSEPYTITADGHIQGADGFIVPRNFTEFNDRFPTYVQRFADERSRWNRTPGEDHAPALRAFLMTLPEESRYREPGTNGHPDGCKDLIEAFNPDSAYGAGCRRFFSYINHCLAYKLVHLRDSHTDETLDPPYDRSTFIKAFADFEVDLYISEYARELIPVADMIENCDSLDEARLTLGLSPVDWTRVTQRILTLFEAMGSPFEDELQA